MKEKQSEWLVIMSLIFSLLLIIFSLIMYILFSNISIKIDSETWGPISTFLGALIGAIITGSVAIIIMYRQNYEAKKNYHIGKYGTMKIIAVNLVSFNEIYILMSNVFSIVESLEKKKDVLTKEDREKMTPLKMTIRIREILLEEKSNIPNEFITRYFSVINVLEYIIQGLQNFIEIGDEQSIRDSKGQLELGQSIITRFRDHAFEYSIGVERKYNFKDAY